MHAGYRALAAVAVAALAVAGTPSPSDAARAGRGDDGHLRIHYWQAPSTLNPYLSGGTKDREAASLVLEPLARYDDEGRMVPALAAVVPTIENGGVAADLRSVTWTLKRGVVWSDGTPFTAADVVFTGEYCLRAATGCNAASSFADVTTLEALDDRTVRIGFGVPKPFPYGPFVGAVSPILQKAQLEGCLEAGSCAAANSRPVGTGPFKVDAFRANDGIDLSANARYREPGKPAFATVAFQGGGDAASAARAALVTGEADYAWNLQVAPEALARMAAAGKGTVLTGFATLVERLVLNLTDDDARLGPDRRSLYLDGANPHPFLADPAVRRALSLALDRRALVEAGYGAAGRPACNILPAPAAYASTANDACLIQDVDAANRLLDAAGWLPGADGVRAKDGVRLSLLFQTSTNAVRQETQALIRGMWARIGVETALRDIDAAVFFGGDPASPDTHGKFYADVQMYADGFRGTDPESYLAYWTCAEMPGPENRWLGTNVPRFCDPAYDALAARLARTAPLAERAALARRMNDLLVADGSTIPLVWRARISARSNTLLGVRMNPWDSELWNAADWHR